MSNTAKVSKSLVGQHDRKMIESLSAVVIDHWVGLHRYGRSNAPVEVKSRLLEILGGGVFEWCWATLGIYGDPLQKDNPQSVARLYAHLYEPSVRPTLCNKVCYSVSMISARMRALSTLAKKAKADEAKELRKAYNHLFGVLYDLLETGALAEMPNSSRHARQHVQALENLVAILPGRWSVLKKRASASGQVGCVNALLGETLGLPVFAGVRAQEEGRAEPGADGLLQWYLAPQARKLRGYYAELGASIHRMAQAAKELRDYRETTPFGTPRRQCASAGIFVIEETMIAVIESGALYCIP